jgi:hypothetical protein
MLLRIAALLTLAASVYFIGRAAEPIVEQNRKVRQWAPVDAMVTARFVGGDGTGGASTRPSESLATPRLQVRYRYQAGPDIFNVSIPSPRADEWLPGGPRLVTEQQGSYTRRGYQDPQRAGALFFPKPLGLRDYWQIFLLAPFLGLGFGGLVALRKPRRVVRAAGAARAERGGWHPLPSKHSIRHRASAAWGVAIVCNVVAGLAAYDYFTAQPRTRSFASDMLVGVALLPGLGVLSFAVYYSSLARRAADARVWIDGPRAAPGTRLAAKVELPARPDLEHVVVSLVSTRSEFVRSRLRVREHVVWEERAERSIARRRAAAGDRIEFEQRFTVPADAQPTSAGSVFGPSIEWQIRVAFHLDNGPDYCGKFPLVVQS